MRRIKPSDLKQAQEFARNPPREIAYTSLVTAGGYEDGDPIRTVARVTIFTDDTIELKDEQGRLFFNSTINGWALAMIYGGERLRG